MVQVEAVGQVVQEGMGLLYIMEVQERQAVVGQEEAVQQVQQVLVLLVQEELVGREAQALCPVGLEGMELMGKIRGEISCIQKAMASLRTTKNPLSGIVSQQTMVMPTLSLS